MFRLNDGGETVTNRDDRIAAAAGEPGAAGGASPHGEIEVWCASLDRWVPGFHLVDRTGEGCLVRRLSDGEVLPLAFSDDQVRPRPAGGGFAGRAPRPT
jgi:hypothetical protein